MGPEQMTWYRYHPDVDHYDGVRLIMPNDEPVVGLHYDCKSVGGSWKPVAVEGFDDNPGVDGDFPSLNNYSKTWCWYWDKRY